MHKGPFMSQAASKTTRHVLAILTFTALVGCQALQPTTQGELALEDGDFMGLWDSYNSCMVSNNVGELQTYLEELHAAPKPISFHESPIPIPAFIKKMNSSRISRLAVDPRAMAASCSLQLAEVARQHQKFDIAVRVLENMKRDFPEPQYAYYVAKANNDLTILNSPFKTVSSSNSDTLRR